LVGKDFSDPAWWPTPPPKPPRKISTAAIVFGTFVPIVVIVILIVAVVGQHKHASAADTGRSLAAFEACMKDQGASSATERSNSRFLQEDAETCRAHLPRGMALPSFEPPSGADQATQRAFSECVQAATANLSRSRLGGPFGGSSARNAFRNAIDTCRSLVGTGRQGGSTPAPAQTTTTTPAVA
jgi:hypothetical protein